MDRYQSIKNKASEIVLINKSRFISDVCRVDTEEEALNFIEGIKVQYPDATHHCYAYSVGHKTEVKRFSDDGEPGGTAGMPILQVMESKGIKNVVAVVTRYFGGIKLGAGGLVRAYSKAASLALDKAETVNMILSKVINIEIDYSFLGIIEHLLNEMGVIIIDKSFQQRVKLTVIVQDEYSKFKEQILNRCNGSAGICLIDEIYYPDYSEQ